MAYVKIKGIDKVSKNIKQEFDRIRKDPELLSEIALISKDDMVKNARAGRGPDKTKFKDVSYSWYTRRLALSKYNNTSEFFPLGLQSKLSFTGNLLSRGIKAFIYPNKGIVEVKADGVHPGYRTKSGRTKPVEYDKIVNGNRKSGRDFLYVSDGLVKRINVLTKRFIRRLISKKKF
jgi:hypothetical protein